MSNEDQMKVDWIRFLDLKRRCFSDLNIFNWHKKLMWRNEFEAHEYPTFELLKGGIIGLTNLFCHLADMYCYGVSAEIIAKEYQDQGQGPFGFWRYRIRNYHIYDLIPKYYSFRDHAAYFVASLTKWEVKDAELEKKRTMSLRKLLPLLRKSLSNPDTIGYLSRDDGERFLDFLRKMDIEPKDKELTQLAAEYRQDMTHLVFPGIDNITQTITPDFATIIDEKGKKKATYNVIAFGLAGKPKYLFENIEKFGKTVIPMIEDSFESLFQTDIMKSFLEQKEE